MKSKEGIDALTRRLQELETAITETKKTSAGPLHKTAGYDGFAGP